MNKESKHEARARLIDAAAEYRRLYSERNWRGLEPIAIQVLLVLDETAANLGQGQALAVDAIIMRLSARRASVSHALRKLRESGLIEEVARGGDRRRRYHATTATGRRYARGFIEFVEAGLLKG